MAIFNPITSTEIQDGAPADTQLFGKVKDNFDNHEARLVAEETDVNVIHAAQIAIDDEPGIYVATNIEAALMEVMQLVNTNYGTNQGLLTAHAGRLTSLEGRATAIETLNGTQDTRISNAESNITSLQSTASNHETRITGNTNSISGNTLNITNLQGRMTTAEGNIIALQTIADNNQVLSLGCASANKQVFASKLVANTGTFAYNAAAASSFGIGTIQSTVAAQELTYNTFIPVGLNIGIGAALVISLPTGASITFGLKCYDATQTFISNVNVVAGQSSTGTSQLIEGHFTGSSSVPLPTNTRFVKPFFSWVSNTGTMNMDFMQVQPLGFSRYSVLG